MKRYLMAAVSVAMLACASSVWAQDEESDDRRWVPVETWTCNFNDGKSMADLDAVVGEWNSWMDDNNVTTYLASIITPNYYGERLFDVGWLGAWKDGNAMGAGTDMWISSGSEMGAKFFEVMDCSSHTNFISTQIKPPIDDAEEDDNTFVLDFTNCSVHDGQTFESVVAGLDAWAAHQAENGFQNSTYMMFPIFGESNDDYAFKLVQGHDDHAGLGTDYELMGNGGHWRKQSELLDGLIDCDIARVYDARSIRDWSDEDAD